MVDERLKQLILDYQEWNGTDAGKRVLSDLKSRFDIRIIPQGMPDCTAFENGKRDVYLYIRDKIEADPNQELQEAEEPSPAFDGIGVPGGY